MKSALTSEQWLRHSGPALEQDLEYAGEEVGGYSGPVSPHGLAALALFGHEYGFTWDDVDMLVSHADFNARTTRGYDPDQDPLLWLAARIAALLPPRPESSRS